MASRVSLTAIYEPVEVGWIQARIKELPGVITAAPTFDEAEEMLTDALREYLLALTESPEAGAGIQDELAARNGARRSAPLEVVIDAA